MADTSRMETRFRPERAGFFQGRPAERRGRWLAAALVLACVAVVGGRAAAGCPRPDVWLVSTRGLPGVCRLPDKAAPAVERLSGGDCGRWERASVGDLLAAADRPLLVFIHGNRYPASDAKSEGVRLARLVAAACPDAAPVRTLIYSWPSTQQGLLFRDARAKYDRAHADGHYLAWLLGQVQPDRDVAVVGYSYGALVGLEAIRDLSAAERTGRPGVAPWVDRPGRTHLVLVAPAVRCDALAPRGPYRGTLACIDRLTILTNSADCALTFFPWVDRAHPTKALGSTTMPRRWLPAHVEYAAVDAAEIVGSQHSLPLYFDSWPLARRIATGAVGGLGDEGR